MFLSQKKHSTLSGATEESVLILDMCVLNFVFWTIARNLSLLSVHSAKWIVTKERKQDAI